MAQPIVLFVGSLVAGLLAFFFTPTDKLLRTVLAFGGAFILGLSFFHILPEAYHNVGVNAGVGVVIGFLMQVVLESFSGGLEHGHRHHRPNGFPWVIFIGLSVHAFVEGLPFGHHGHSHGSGQWSFLLGIMLHKVPVTFVLGSMLKIGQVSFLKFLTAILVFSLMAPLGSLAMWLFPSGTPDTLFYTISAMVVGMLLHVSTTILYESDKGHQFNFMKTSVIIIALIISYLASIIH